MDKYLRSVYLPEKCVFRVCLESLFTRMISTLKYRCPPMHVGLNAAASLHTQKLCVNQTRLLPQEGMQTEDTFHVVITEEMPILTDSYVHKVEQR